MEQQQGVEELPVPNAEGTGESILSDADLTGQGFIKVQAFMRSETSAGAERSKKARKKADETGVGQLNVVAPKVAHGIIKQVAKHLQNDRPLGESLETLLLVEARAIEPTAVVRIMPAHTASQLDELVCKLSGLRGWRRLLAQFIGLRVTQTLPAGASPLNPRTDSSNPPPVAAT